MSGVRGIGSIRRFIKQMPDVVKRQLAMEMEEGGQEFRQIMRAKAPNLTGHTRNRIAYRILPNTLRLRIGYVGGKREFVREGLFYSRIQDLGRKAQVVRYQRRKRGVRKRLIKGRKPTEDLAQGGKFYEMRVRAMAPKRFISGRQPEARVKFGKRLLKAFDRGVAIASRGVKP